MTTITMIRTLSGLAPADDAGRDILRKLALGQSVEVEIQRERVRKNLRKWWALMGLIADNCEHIRSKEQASDLVKILAGHCASIVSKSSGEVYQIADSIAFGRLDEDEFQDVWQRAVKAVTEHIIPGITEQEIEDEILRLCGASTWTDNRRIAK